MSAGAGYNLALYRPTWQISDLNTVYTSNKAVDCNTDDNCAGNSCAHTNLASWPWWAVDLGLVVAVKTVMITNRGDYDRKLDASLELRVVKFVSNLVFQLCKFHIISKQT